MWWALIKKELRDLWPIGLAALVCYMVVVGGVTGIEWLARIKRMFGVDIIPPRTASIPFFGQFMEYFIMISVGFLVILAKRQLGWEEAKGTYPFLLHRPMSRWSIFLAKIVAGLGLYLTVSLFSVSVYGMWAVTPGNHPSPFEWSMTANVLQVLFVLPVLYLGLFVMALRQGRWFGTRLLPFAACCGLALLFARAPLDWIWLIVAAFVVFPALLFHIAYWADNRDFG